MFVILPGRKRTQADFKALTCAEFKFTNKSNTNCPHYHNTNNSLGEKFCRFEVE